MPQDTPISPFRLAYALFSALILATFSKAVMVLLLPNLLHSSLSALAGNFQLANLLWDAVRPIALAGGLVGALLCLVPVLLLARVAGASTVWAYMVAGAAAEGVHNLIGSWLGEMSLPQLGYRQQFNLALIPQDPALQTPLTIALAALIAGALAGAAFAAQVLPSQQKLRPIYYRPAFVAVVVALLLSSWSVFHDREGDHLCPHTDAVRVVIGGNYYRIPAVMQPAMEAQKGQAPPHIFYDQNHRFSAAEKQARYQNVYCQVDKDPAWRVRYFTIPPDMAGMPHRLPYGFFDVTIVASEGGLPAMPHMVFLAPPPGVAQTELREVSGIPLPDGEAMIMAHLRNGDLMTSRVSLNLSHPSDVDGVLEQLGGLLASLQGPIRP